VSAATEEEECNGCDGADPRRRLDDSLLRLADGILLRSIVATTASATATAVGSTAIATMSMPVIDIGALFIGREDREGDDGSSVAMEDDDDTDAEAGGGTRAWAGRFGRRRTTTKTETSRDDEHEEDVAMRSKFETLCKGEPSSLLSTARAGGADPSRTKQSRTGQRRRRRRNGGCVGDNNDYEQLPYIQRRDDSHNNIIFNKKHIICLIYCN
jgi:hypothetical protein